MIDSFLGHVKSSSEMIFKKCIKKKKECQKKPNYFFHSLQLKCEFVKGPGNIVTCPSFPEIHYDKQISEQHKHNCAIVVENIQEHHEGNWKCEFEIDAPNEEDPEQPMIIKERVKLLARGYRYV